MERPQTAAEEEEDDDHSNGVGRPADAADHCREGERQQPEESGLSSSGSEEEDKVHLELDLRKSLIS